MAYTFNGNPIQNVSLNFPRGGIWTARGKLAGDKFYAVGDAVTIVVGDLTLKGTVRQGSVFQSSAEYIVVGGKDGWSKQITNRHYRTDAGVKLSLVWSDLGKDAGETVVLQAGTDRSLGYSWNRAAGTASEALAALSTRWWVAADGTTFLGDRLETKIPETIKWTLQSYDPQNKTAVLGVDNDNIKAFQPGVRLTTKDLDIVARSVRATVTDRRVVVEVMAF